MKKPYLILVAGGSASGKTTVVKSILKKSNLKDVIHINQDDYYNDQRHLSLEERMKNNYDHPNSIDNDLLFKQLSMLLKNNSVEKPVYDFINYTRSDKVELINPKPIIIIEGILILTDPRIRNLADFKIYVESDDDIRFIRRLIRDIKERGRNLDTVVDQYLKTVKPMHHQFVKPTKRYADIIIPNDNEHKVAVDMMVRMINQIVEVKN